MSRQRKTILITGGSRGIGRETALLAGSRGWSVAVNYRSDKVMAETTCKDLAALGADGVAIQGDIADEDDVVRLFQETLKTFGRLDAVVINAGIVGPTMPLAEMSRARLQKTLEVNVLGAMLCAREAARHLGRSKDEPQASIVFVSSAASRLGSPFTYVDYAASKGAIDSLTLGLSKELAGKNIRVNAVRPGIIKTEIHASGGEPDRAERVGAQIPLGRAGEAQEVANAILWLCSEDASYTTGALLDVAGGR